jgi:hypothetical protein
VWKPSKYFLYENSVQSPEAHVELLAQIASAMAPKKVFRRMREDFCGTFLISCEWVKTHPQNTALGLDLDPEPVAYGKKTHWSRLTGDQRRRLRIEQRNVISVTRPRVDLVVAANFSFYIFKRRSLLLEYFRKVRASLSQGGLFILEMAGGPGMIQSMREWKPVYVRSGSARKRFTYVWDQLSFDPITHDVRYAIHFHVGGRKIESAFEYDWRLWTIPEVRDALIEAGFKGTAVFWETEDENGEGTGEYELRQNGDNAVSWIAQVVGHL